MKRWSLRKKSRISYCESIEPPLDNYVYCDKCCDFVYEYCSIHGPLLVVPDEVPQDSQTAVPRAALTIPHLFLHIAHSYIPGAGLGVFSSVSLPSGIRFGPYCGDISTDIQSNYCWQIYDNSSKPRHVVDAAEVTTSNWMRYVNCSRHFSEQNLIAYQYEGELYYRTIKLIPRFTELLVFYGGEFASSLHIDLRLYNNPNEGWKLRYLTPHSNNREANKNTNLDAAAEIEKMDVSNKENYIDIQYHNDTISISTIESDDEAHEDKFANGDNITDNYNSANNCSAYMDDVINKDTLLKEDNTLNIDIANNDSLVPNAYNLANCNSSLPNTYNLANNYNLTQNNEAHINNLTNENLQFEEDLSSDIQLNSLTQSKTNIIMISGLFSCMHCDFKRPYKYLVSKHIRQHHKEKCFTCDYCTLSFVSEINLHTHIQSHTNIKPHTQVKPQAPMHSCNECEYKTTVKRNFMKHILIHKEKLYTCNICQLKTNYLKRHLQTHENWYNCSKCEFKCKTKISLSIHFRLHLNMKLYKCDQCYYNSPSQKNFKTHLRRHKNNEAPSLTVDYNRQI